VDVAHDAPECRPTEEPVGRPTISGLMDQLRATMGARVHLFELEAKRAAWSAAYMLAFAVAAALLGVTAWVLLVVGLIGLAVTLGVPWWAATLVAIIAHALVAWLLLRRIRTMVDNLTFNATRRTFARHPEGKVDGGNV
jgi:hypothetical protein